LLKIKVTKMKFSDTLILLILKQQFCVAARENDEVIYLKIHGLI